MILKRIQTEMMRCHMMMDIFCYNCYAVIYDK